MNFDSPGINELRALSDTNALHVLHHYLYFADESKASKASQQLEQRGFEVVRGRSADGENWLVLASHIAMPTEERIGTIRADMENLAYGLAGEYDGWEAEVVPRGKERSSANK